MGEGTERWSEEKKNERDRRKDGNERKMEGLVIGHMEKVMTFGGGEVFFASVEIIRDIWAFHFFL